MRTDIKQLETYESIMQNLLDLKEKAIEANPREAKAIEAILCELSAIRNHLGDPNVKPSHSIHQDEIPEAVPV